MNENEKNVLEDEDVIMLDESDFEDTPVEEETEEAKEKVAESTEQTSEVPETEEKTDEQKLLELLSSKVKFNGENIKINSLDEVVANFQKGLNYDKVQNRNETITGFITEKAKSMGLTPEQYIEQVKNYEQEQIKAKNEQAINSMIQSGVPEDVAREVVETRALRESLKREKAELEEQKKSKELEEQKNKEYQNFLEAYPEIDASTIPAEVFEEAKNSNLLSAYRAYENRQLKEKLKQMEQTQKNASTSVVNSVTDTGTVDDTGKDAFLIGFDSV